MLEPKNNQGPADVEVDVQLAAERGPLSLKVKGAGLFFLIALVIVGLVYLGSSGEKNAASFAVIGVLIPFGTALLRMLYETIQPSNEREK